MPLCKKKGTIKEKELPKSVQTEYYSFCNQNPGTFSLQIPATHPPSQDCLRFGQTCSALKSAEGHSGLEQRWTGTTGTGTVSTLLFHGYRRHPSFPFPPRCPNSTDADKQSGATCLKCREDKSSISGAYLGKEAAGGHVP